MKMHSLAFAAVVLVAGGSAQADTYTAVGSLTAADATFNRPLTLTSLSTVGTAVHYDQLLIVGATPGAYDFRMVGRPAGSLDTFLLLYNGLFDPASPLTGLLALNDDFTTIASGSGFSFNLTAGSLYTVVSTAFSNTGLGDYTTTATTVAVPEVGTYGLMALGLAFVGAAVRRRSKRA